MSNTQKTGRHTPLTLNNTGGKNKKNSRSNESIPVPTVVSTEKILVEPTKQSKTSHQKQSKNLEEPIKAVHQEQPIATMQSSQISKSIKQAVSVHVTDSNPANEKVNQNDNGSTEEKVSNGGQKSDEISSNNSTDEKKIRESPRQKTLKETAISKDDDKKKQTEILDVTIDEIPLEKCSELSDVVVSITPTRNQDTNFSGDDDLEALMMQVEFPDGGSGSPMPPAQTPGRILKFGLTGCPPPTRARISPFRRSDRVQPNASIIVNLSTVSEQSTDAITAKTTGNSPESHTTDKSFSSALRAISGRKSLRPLREMSFQNSYRETYRTLNESTTSSMNATVGSDDIGRSPIFNILARKRDRIQIDSHNKIEQIHETDLSPKRPRLDLSAFLDIVASPVTLLRRKLQGTKLQSSTPNKRTTEDDVIIDTVNGSDIDIEKMEDTDIIIEEENNIMEKEIIKNDVLKVQSIDTLSLPKKNWCIIM